MNVLVTLVMSLILVHYVVTDNVNPRIMALKKFFYKVRFQ